MPIWTHKVTNEVGEEHIYALMKGVIFASYQGVQAVKAGEVRLLGYRNETYNREGEAIRMVRITDMSSKNLKGTTVDDISSQMKELDEGLLITSRAGSLMCIHDADSDVLVGGKAFFVKNFVISEWQDIIEKHGFTLDEGNLADLQFAKKCRYDESYFSKNKINEKKLNIIIERLRTEYKKGWADKEVNMKAYIEGCRGSGFVNWNGNILPFTHHMEKKIINSVSKVFHNGFTPPSHDTYAALIEKFDIEESLGSVGAVLEKPKARRL